MKMCLVCSTEELVSHQIFHRTTFLVLQSGGCVGSTEKRARLHSVFVVIVVVRVDVYNGVDGGVCVIEIVVMFGGVVVEAVIAIECCRRRCCCCYCCYYH